MDEQRPVVAGLYGRLATIIRWHFDAESGDVVRHINSQFQPKPSRRQKTPAQGRGFVVAMMLLCSSACDSSGFLLPASRHQTNDGCAAGK